MDCLIYGMLGAGFLVSSLFTLSVSEEQHKILRDKFPDDLDKIYNKIVEERRNHYIQGIGLGLVLSYIIFNQVNNTNTFHKMALFFTITLSTAVFYYFLMPKSDYMLNHLKTPEENKAWLSVYKTMKQRYFVGFVLGALSSIPLSNALC